MSLEQNSREVRESAKLDREVSPLDYDFDWGSDFEYFFVPQEGGNAGYEDVVIGGALDEEFQIPLFEALDLYEVGEGDSPLYIYLLDNQATQAFMNDISEYNGEEGLFVSPDYNPHIERPTVLVDMEEARDERSTFGEELAHYKAFERGWNSVANEVNRATFEVLDRKQPSVSPETKKIMHSINQGIKEIFANHVSYEAGGLEEVEKKFNNSYDTKDLPDVSDFSDFRKFRLMVSVAEDVYPPSIPNRQELIDDRLSDGRMELKKSLPEELDPVIEGVFEAYEDVEVPPSPWNIAQVESDIINSWLLMDDSSSVLMSGITPQEIAYEFEDLNSKNS